MPDEIPQPSPCPADCPNRRIEAARGKWAAYCFALVVSLFLGWQQLSADRRHEQLPLWVLVPCLTLVGTALGVPINAATVNTLLNGGK